MSTAHTTTHTTTDAAQFAGPAWDNSSEYPSFTSPQFEADEQTVRELVDILDKKIAALAPLFAASRAGTLGATDEARLISEMQQLSTINDRAEVLAWNLTVFCYCEKSVDATNPEATKKESQLATLRSRLEQAIKPWSMFLSTGPAKIVEAYLDHEQTRGERFRILHDRKLNDTLLSEPEEKLLAAMSTAGHHAWSDLYEAIAGNLRCKIKDSKTGEIKEFGLAQASGYLRSADEAERKAAWEAITSAWREQREPCAAILNALAGWRLELAKKRSHSRKVDFLTQPTHSDFVQLETLETMIAAIRARIHVPRGALNSLAKALGKNQLDPWDLLAAAPSRFGSRLRSFEEGFEIVVQGFNAVAPEMGDFARMMLKNKWIEARVLSSKQQGGYCTSFEKSRSPRIFQTYMGSISDIQTLAHELGHAYHSWVMRDMKRAEQWYPSTLAETASVFAETAVADALSKQEDKATKLSIGWQVAESAGAFLINIPARFEFEKSFYELRSQRFVPAEELSSLTEKAWLSWYGKSLSQADSMFWASKLHFSMAGRSFYNYPYAFGYLFSLGIYAQREKWGAGFMRAYKEVLRDTGRMTAEELIKKHLDEDISKPEFWLNSLGIVERKINDFDTLLATR